MGYLPRRLDALRGGPTFRSDLFQIEQVGRGIWAAIGRPGSSILSNAGIVDLGTSTLVFDTFLTPQASSDLRTAAQVLTGRNPAFVVNSHWHFDHTLGNAMFGACTIYGTATTARLLTERGQALLVALEDPSWVEVTAALRIRTEEEKRPFYRHELGSELAARMQLRDARDRVRIRAPDSILEYRYTFPGPRSAMIVAGAGHSESDTVLFVTDEEVLFTGDLVSVGVHPRVGLPDVERWRSTLDKVANVRPRVLVPGHGPVADTVACDAMKAYLDLIESVAGRNTPAEVPAEYANWLAPGRFHQSVALLRAARAG